MLRRLVAMLVFAMVMAIAGVASVQGVAEADEPDYSDPNEVVALITRLEASDDMTGDFLALPVAAQHAVIDAVFNNIQVSDVESNPGGDISYSASASAASDSDEDCHSKYASRYAYAIVKSIKIWKYTSKRMFPK